MIAKIEPGFTVEHRQALAAVLSVACLVAFVAANRVLT